VTTYTVVVHSEAEGGFWAEVPALAGCYSQGETMAELTANVREAIGVVLAVLKSQGSQPEIPVQVLEITV